MALAGATSLGLVRLGNCAGTISSRARVRHSSRASHYASSFKESERGEAFVPDLLTATKISCSAVRRRRMRSVMRIIRLDIQIMQFSTPAPQLSDHPAPPSCRSTMKAESSALPATVLLWIIPTPSSCGEDGSANY